MNQPFLPFPTGALTILRIRYAVVTLIGAVSTALGAVALAFATSPAIGVGAWLIGGVPAVGFAWWWAKTVYRLRSWRLTEETVELRKGVIIQHHIVLPRNRVQNVTINSGPIRRYLGVADVVVHSAGAATPNIILQALSSTDAELLQHHLLPDRNFPDQPTTVR